MIFHYKHLRIVEIIVAYSRAFHFFFEMNLQIVEIIVAYSHLVRAVYPIESTNSRNYSGI